MTIWHYVNLVGLILGAILMFAGWAMDGYNHSEEYGAFIPFVFGQLLLP